MLDEKLRYCTGLRGSRLYWRACRPSARIVAGTDGALEERDIKAAGLPWVGDNRHRLSVAIADGRCDVADTALERWRFACCIKCARPARIVSKSCKRMDFVVPVLRDPRRFF